jgi:hypothetical protein
MRNRGIFIQVIKITKTDVMIEKKFANKIGEKGVYDSNHYQFMQKLDLNNVF